MHLHKTEAILLIKILVTLHLLLEATINVFANFFQMQIGHCLSETQQQHFSSDKRNYTTTLKQK